MFNGTSLFNPTVNVIQIFFHFIGKLRLRLPPRQPAKQNSSILTPPSSTHAGSIFLSWLITMSWNYQALWPIVISCNIPTALLELWMLLRIYVLKITVY